MADENELDRLAGLRPDAPRPDMISDRLGYPAEVGDQAYTELARLQSAPDPERDARREAYQERERRRAARALDRYIEAMFVSPADVPQHLGMGASNVAADRFVEAVGDYVLSTIKEHWQDLIERYDQAFRDHVEQGLQQNRHYGVPTPPGMLFGNDAHGGAPDGIGSMPFEGCDWPAEQCSGHYSIRALPTQHKRDSGVGVPRCPVDGQWCSTCPIGGGNGTGGTCARQHKSDHGVSAAELADRSKRSGKSGQ